MSNEKKTGGPAFPVNTEMKNGGCEPSSGMTLRDYFAANVDIPWNVCVDACSKGGNYRPTMAEVVEYRAKIRLLEADAMLKAREQ